MEGEETGDGTHCELSSLLPITQLSRLQNRGIPLTHSSLQLHPKRVKHFAQQHLPRVTSLLCSTLHPPGPQNGFAVHQEPKAQRRGRGLA